MISALSFKVDYFIIFSLLGQHYFYSSFRSLIEGTKPSKRKNSSKNDLTKVARLYFSRWKIEEYFRVKKQIFDFENIRVRSLIAINALNFCITVCMALLIRMTMKRKTNLLFASIIEAAKPIKQKVNFLCYRLAFGIVELPSCAKQGIKDWFKPLCPNPFQMKLRLLA